MEGQSHQICEAVIDFDDCQDSLRDARRENSRRRVLGSRFKLHRSFLCAGGGEETDTCTGDGGSPLVCPDPENVDGGQYVQVNSVPYFYFYIIFEFQFCFLRERKLQLICNIYVYRLELFHGD